MQSLIANVTRNFILKLIDIGENTTLWPDLHSNFFHKKADGDYGLKRIHIVTLVNCPTCNMNVHHFASSVHNTEATAENQVFNGIETQQCVQNNKNSILKRQFCGSLGLPLTQLIWRLV